MGTIFYITGKEEVRDMKEFCRLKDELTYIGQFADKKTSLVIRGTIIEYNGKFYTNELLGRAGVGSFTNSDGKVTTCLELFETNDYAPEKCKPVSDCPIYISIWNTHVEEEGPICSYAFYEEQQEEAKEVVRCHRDVDIFFKGKKMSKEDFLEI